MNKLIKETKLYDGKIVKLSLKEYEFNNTKIYREVINHNGGVCVVAVKDDNIFLVKQYRHAAESYTLELPAGCIEKGETPFESISREIQEEIGYKANKIELLGSFYPTPGYSNELIHIYLATDLEESKLPEDDDECLEIYTYKVSELKEMIENNTIVDGKTMLGILLYLNRLNNLK